VANASYTFSGTSPAGGQSGACRIIGTVANSSVAGAPLSATAPGKLLFPTSGPISACFSSGLSGRDACVGLTRQKHNGLDIAIPTNTPVKASADGRVVFARLNTGGYGNTVVIDHGGGMHTLYAHNNTLSVKEGDTVKQGQEVAKGGAPLNSVAAGSSTGPHLHWEVRLNYTFTLSGASIPPAKTYANPCAYTDEPKCNPYKNLK
jgi:murein DD-endopeptidase MepM/ murein hydrolase activator NlpD